LTFDLLGLGDVQRLLCLAFVFFF